MSDLASAVFFSAVVAATIVCVSRTSPLMPLIVMGELPLPIFAEHFGTIRTLGELTRVLGRHPHDRDSLAAGVAFHREAGDLRSALRCAEQLAAIDPQDPAAIAAVNELRAQVARR